MVFEHLPDTVGSSCSYSRSPRGRRTRPGMRESLRIQMMRTSRPFRVSKCLCVDNGGQGPGVSQLGSLVMLGGCAIEEMQLITFGLLVSPI